MTVWWINIFYLGPWMHAAILVCLCWKHCTWNVCTKGLLLICSQPACPVCHLPISVDLDAPALEFGEEARTAAGKQGILGRLDLDTWRSSTKIEALIEELTNLRRQDATTKSIVFSQFVNFLDLVAFRLQRAGFNVRVRLWWGRTILDFLFCRYADWKEQWALKLVTRRLSISVSWIVFILERHWPNPPQWITFTSLSS